MSATIDTNDLKFVIFGAGHDYTLLDSGKGEKMIFSHPFVPLNSVNYAGQYYFTVVDENGVPFDAVKDDIGHCTFDPPLGTAFSAEGEATVKCHYHREYIHDEETIVVDKTVSQTITVVNHGSVVRSATSSVLRDIYSDGYCFWRPYNVNSAVASEYHAGFTESTQDRTIKKSSCIPWRATKLGQNQTYPFGKWRNIEDISELAFADLSQCTVIYGLFGWSGLDVYCKVTDFSALAEWDISNVKQLTLIVEGVHTSDLSFLSKWNVSNVTSLESCFDMTAVQSFHGLENWNVSSCKSFKAMFDAYGKQQYGVTPDYLPSLEPLATWDTSNVEDMSFMLAGDRINSLHGLENWNVSKVKTLEGFFNREANDSSKANPLTNLDALENWTPHLEGNGMRKFLHSAYSDGRNFVTNLDGIKNFDVSKCTSLYQTFQNCLSLSDIGGLENWNVGLVTDFRSAFDSCNSLSGIEDIENWDMTSATNMSGMFNTSGTTKDATPAQSWNVSGSGMGAFNSNWTNIPAWN